MTAWLAPILVLGLVIIVHEAGHFWAAKLFGVYAPRFAIGFGPPLRRRRWGETEYVIGALPLGGYVRMATRDDVATTTLEGGLEESKGGDAEPLDPDAMVPFGPKPVPPERWFESKPLWQRAIIMLAGVSMNIVLAVVVATSVIATYGFISRPPVVASVVDSMPGARGGLRAGDSITAVNGTATRTWGDVQIAVIPAAGRELSIQLVRDGAPVTIHVTPVAALDTNPATGQTDTIGRVGMLPVTRTTREHVSLGTALVEGGSRTLSMAGSVVDVLRLLVTGRLSVTQLGGPVAIARASVGAARTGFENLLALIAFLSVNLAILNLLPIPLLDGGQLVMQVAETIKGSAFSDQTREWIARVGLAAIAALFLVVTFNDLKNLVGSWMH